MKSAIETEFVNVEIADIVWKLRFFVCERVTFSSSSSSSSSLAE